MLLKLICASDLIAGGIGDVFKIIGNFFNIIGDFVKVLMNLALALPLALVLTGVMLIAAFAEMVFKKLAGIDVIYMNNIGYGGPDSGQDLVYGFITSQAVQDVFWSIIALSIVLLFIFTIVALIRSEFTLDLKGSAKGPIIGRALKSLANFIIIPVVTLISVIGVNYLTKTVYKLFDTGGDSVVSKCFYVGAYNANRARLSPSFAKTLSEGKDFDGTPLFEGDNNPFSGKQVDEVAYMIDEYFLEGATNVVKFNSEVATKNYFNRALKFAGEGYVNLSLMIFGYPNGDFNPTNIATINYYYDLAEFDFILAIGTALCMAWILLTTCLVLVKRIFELTILFLLSPVMVAIAPLDGGQAEKKWRQEFMKRLLAVIGPIFAFNMYFLLVPLFSTISLFGSDYTISALSSSSIANNGSMLIMGVLLMTSGIAYTFDIFFQLICVITGMSIVKSASALLSNLLGIDDLVKSGGEAGKKAIETGAKAMALASGVGGAAVKGASMAIRGGKAAFNYLKNKGTDGAASARKAKWQLGKAKRDVKKDQTAYDKSENEVSDLEAQARESKTYRDNEDIIADLEKRKAAGTLDEAGEKDLKDAIARRDDIVTAAGGKSLADAREKRDKAKEALDTSKKGLSYRESGISKEDQRKIEMWEEGRADDKFGTQLYGKAALDKKKEAKKFRDQASKVSFRDFYKDEKEKEWGEHSAKTSFAGKSATKIKDKLQDKYGKDSFLGGLGGTLESLFAVDGKFAKRRINDGLAGVFGEGGGGQLWKWVFNPNARAGLFENVPESKTRSANIEAGMTMGGREKYQKDNARKEARKETEKEIRRMLAEESGNRAYLNAVRERDSATDPTTIKKLDAKIEKMELEGGLAAQATFFYDHMNEGGRAEQFKAYQARMKAAADEEGKKQAQAEQNKYGNGGGAGSGSGDKGESGPTPVKFDHANMNELKEKFKEAFMAALQKQGIKVDAAKLQEALNDSSMKELGPALMAVVEALRKLSGDNSGGGTKPGQ